VAPKARNGLIPGLERSNGTNLGPQQKPLLQKPLRQSVLIRQRWPGEQRRHAGSLPPQSKSVSVPSITPSPHEMQTPFRQLLLIQSLACEQRKRSRQRWQAGSLPPQSMSVSLPSTTPSPHEMQTPFAQLLLMQSVGCRQAVRSGQRGQVFPPQSTPVSAPFWIRSVQLDTAQRPN
jgi:hypothetical protein